MVIATNDMGYAHVDVVDNGCECVEIGAIPAHQDRIRKRGEIDGLLAAHQIRPACLGAYGIFGFAIAEIRQQKPPVRLAPLALQGRDLVRSERQRLAPVDRGEFARQPHLSPQFQFFLGFVAWIEQAGGLEALDGGVVAVEAPRLILRLVRINAEPMQVVESGVGEFLLRAGDICIVETLDEASPMLQRKQPVEQGGARIADVDIACRRWSETDGDCHGRSR